MTEKVGLKSTAEVICVSSSLCTRHRARGGGGSRSGAAVASSWVAFETWEQITISFSFIQGFTEETFPGFAIIWLLCYA